MKLSFLITYYNQAGFVDRSIQSIISALPNLPKEIEILIGDDGSSDETMTKIEEWRSKYPNLIRVFQMERDTNVKYNPLIRVGKLNWFLLNQARGEYVAKLDGDDHYCDAGLASLAIDELDKDKSLAMIGFNFDYVRGEEKSAAVQNIQDPRITLKTMIIKGIYIHLGAIVMRNKTKEILASKGIDAINIGLINDAGLTYTMLEFGDMLYIDKPFFAYRLDAGGILAGEPEICQLIQMAMTTDVTPILYPQVKWLILHRSFHWLERLWKEKKHIHTLLSTEQITKHQKLAKNFVPTARHTLVCDIIGWNKLGLWRKLLCCIKYFYLKFASKLLG